MAQGRLPVGPDDEEHPDPQQRVERKIDAVRKVLQLEQAKGHADSAVFGGVDRFLERWVEDPDIQEALNQARIPLPTYAALSVPERAAWVADTLARLEGIGAPSASRPPPPTPPDSEPSSPSPGQLRRSASRGTGRARPRAVEAGTPPKPSTRRRAAPAPPPASLDEPLPVPPRIAGSFKRLGIETYRQALWAFPRRYLEVVPVSHLVHGQPQAIAVTVQRVSSRQFGRRRQFGATEALVGDGTGQIQAVWFGRTWVARSLRQGSRFLLTGRLNEFRGAVQFSVETQEQLSSGEEVRVGDLVPIYPLTEGVTQRGMRSVVAPAAERAMSLVQEYLPAGVRESARLPGLQEALRTIHHPRDLDEERGARRRLAFDEIFLLQLGLLERRRTRQSELGAAIPIETDVLERFLGSLPFVLTGDQRRALDEILADMGRSAPMMRLLQGDVGSGKTVVAGAALVVATARGFQGALMAPTEVLAEQHFKTLTGIFGTGQGAVEDAGPYRGFSGVLEGRPLRVALLTGSMSSGAKEMLHQLIARGDVDIAIGTHALIQEGVGFANLGLAVVDEQHRFGVEQRAALRQKGFAPHLLVMTATPIPRTMALAVYGDLDVSTIKEMPPGRPEVRTVALMPEERERAYGFIRREAAEGRQAFVICPLVEESEAIEARAAVAEHQRLSQEVFPDLRVGLLHGRMRPRRRKRSWSGSAAATWTSWSPRPSWRWASTSPTRR